MPPEMKGNKGKERNESEAVEDYDALPKTSVRSDASTASHITSYHHDSSTMIQSPSQESDIVEVEVSKQELQTKTGRERLCLGSELDKINTASSSSKNEEEKDASVSLTTARVDQSAENITGIHAATWEEAGNTIHLARFKREEIRIQVWEDHQKAKIEAVMRKIDADVKVERMRAYAQKKLSTKLETVKQVADKKRADAELKRNKAVARTAEQAEHIRGTGQLPSTIGCWNWCSGARSALKTKSSVP